MRMTAVAAAGGQPQEPAWNGESPAAESSQPRRPSTTWFNVVVVVVVIVVGLLSTTSSPVDAQQVRPTSVEASTPAERRVSELRPTRVSG